MEIFEHYEWDGNVRELENTIEGIMSLYDMEIIDVEHLPQKFNHYKDDGQAHSKSLVEILEEKEKELLINALKTTDGNITHTAELLKIPRQTLQYKLSKYEIK